MDAGLKEATHMRPVRYSPEEWQLRLELAACYRLTDWMGWTELIYNHITARIPGTSAGTEPSSSEKPQFLINPFGLHYSEVTASNLLKIDIEGNKLEESPHPILLAGFIIHSAIHAAREDAHCIMHTHTTAGMAVSCKQDGLRADNFYSVMLDGKVAYHDFEGVTTDSGEQARIVASLGNSNQLIFRNHGLLSIGSSVPDMFFAHWRLNRACEIQLATDTLAGPVQAISPEVIAATPARMRTASKVGNQGNPNMVFQAMLRKAGIRYIDLV